MKKLQLCFMNSLNRLNKLCSCEIRDKSAQNRQTWKWATQILELSQCGSKPKVGHRGHRLNSLWVKDFAHMGKQLRLLESLKRQFTPWFEVSQIHRQTDNSVWCNALCFHKSKWVTFTICNKLPPYTSQILFVEVNCKFL